MPGPRKLWWVSHKGEIRHQPTRPKGSEGWRSFSSPEDLPEIFKPGDRFLQLVPAPSGEGRFIELRLTDDGKGWELHKIFSEDEAIEIAKGARAAYGVPTDDEGTPMDVERWK